MTLCPVCNGELRNTTTQHDDYFHECLRCGPYRLTLEASYQLKHTLSTVKNGPAIVSYALYRMTRQKQWAVLNSTVLRNVLDNTHLPSPPEQLKNLILWFADHQDGYGSIVQQLPPSVLAAIGVVDLSGLAFIFDYAIERGLLTGHVSRMMDGDIVIHSCQLTFDGWRQYEELQRGAITSRSAFMAMKFGDAEMDGIYQEHFKPAVAATGFDLRRNDELQQAGLIDDLMRIQIQQSRFLIADLTHHNNGAYWEAGYAEGLGKSVIYTCRKDVFDDADHRPHFDTNHHLTVVWQPGEMDAAVRKLKATIRATLPEDAKLSDD